MNTKTYYTLVIDGKEMAKSKLLSQVALKPEVVGDHYEINKYQNGKIVKSWGYTINPENNQRVPFTIGSTSITKKLFSFFIKKNTQYEKHR